MQALIVVMMFVVVLALLAGAEAYLRWLLAMQRLRRVMDAEWQATKEET